MNAVHIDAAREPGRCNPLLLYAALFVDLSRLSCENILVEVYGARLSSPLPAALMFPHPHQPLLYVHKYNAVVLAAYPLIFASHLLHYD